MSTRKLTVGQAGPDDTEALYRQIREVLAQARQQTWRNVNQVMVQAYWLVGRAIVQHEQAGQARASYGGRVLDSLSERLTREFGKGYAPQSLRNFRQFFLSFPDEAEIRSTPWSELSWSRPKALMRVADMPARHWYATEASGQTWRGSGRCWGMGLRRLGRDGSGVGEPGVAGGGAEGHRQAACADPGPGRNRAASWRPTGVAGGAVA